jgi:hypothetical protein
MRSANGGIASLLQLPRLLAAIAGSFGDFAPFDVTEGFFCPQNTQNFFCVFCEVLNRRRRKRRELLLRKSIEDRRPSIGGSQIRHTDCRTTRPLISIEEVTGSLSVSI